jgi:hypothetical protein
MPQAVYEKSTVDRCVRVCVVYESLHYSRQVTSASPCCCVDLAPLVSWRTTALLAHISTAPCREAGKINTAVLRYNNAHHLLVHALSSYSRVAVSATISSM